MNQIDKTKLNNFYIVEEPMQLRMIKVINKGKIELINFNHVAKINLQYENRIILNFDHTITRGAEPSKYSGFYYIEKEDVTNYEEIYRILFESEFEDFFTKIQTDEMVTGFVNKKCISTVKCADHNNMVIFNLSHSVSPSKNSNNNNPQFHSSDSIISGFKDSDGYDKYLDYVMTSLGQQD